jgi:flagellar biosynthesis protein FlhF
MKIKRFVADTMREALAQVREEQGPDAVIISNRRIDGGIELITAVDYDETLIEDALARLRTAPTAQPAAPVPAPVVPKSAPAPRLTKAAATRPPPPKAAPVPQDANRAAPPVLTPDVIARPPAVEPATLRVAAAQDAGLMAMRREVETLRTLLQDQMASLAWSDRLRREPQKSEVLRSLSLMGLAPDVARSLTERVPAAAVASGAERMAAAVLLKYLAVTDDDLLTKGGTYALVGPTGVGKTTTIAKLAARWVLKNGTAGVALVSLDHHRIGARDQLLTFARILGVPMHVATSARELAAVLDRLSDRQLVLIDTAGMSPRDERLAEQFMTLNVPGHQIHPLLVLAANAEQAALDHIVRSYSRIRPEAVVLTKLDEAASLGAALSVTIRHALPLGWLADGQRIPDDLSPAQPKRVWLVKRAGRLATESRDVSGIDEAYMAGHFGKVVTHG